MIQDIYPHVLDNSFKILEPRDDDFALIFYKDGVLMVEQEQPALPQWKNVNSFCKEKCHYLFSIDDTGYYLVESDTEYHCPGMTYYPAANTFRNHGDSVTAFAGITAWQLFRWERDKRFCSRCGSRMHPSEIERAMCCSECGLIEYPKISPAVIIAITHNDKLLMIRNKRGNVNMFSLVAGYVEIGETLEETVSREAYEEVHLKLKNVKYFGSQPWSFSDTIMIGFTAEVDGDDVVEIQESEVAEAKWFSRDEVPFPANNISIGSALIYNFMNKNK